MKKSDFIINKNQIETAYQQIKEKLNEHDWWDNEKSRKKAIKHFNALKLEDVYDKIKVDSHKYFAKFLSLIQKWCAKCLDKKHWQKLKEEIEANINKQGNQSGINQIELSHDAYLLLQQTSEKSGKAISDLIIENFSANEETLPNTEVKKQSSDFTSYNNADFVAEKLKQYHIVDKNGQQTIEVYQLAGGQCQSISKATKKRCKKISPDLQVIQEMINGICYEYAVCSTHNKSNAQLDKIYIKNFE